MTSEVGLAITVLAADTKLPEPVASGWQLILAALAAIALIVVLITIAKLHPFLALIFGALTMGIVAGENVGDVLDSFGNGFGTTAAGVGILIALGAMFAKLLADSGGADEIVDTIVGHASPRALPWAMALVGAIIGLPMFFEIGLVLLMPVIYLVAKRSQLSLITVGRAAAAAFCAVYMVMPLSSAWTTMILQVGHAALIASTSSAVSSDQSLSGGDSGGSGAVAPSLFRMVRQPLARVHGGNPNCARYVARSDSRSA